MPTADRTLSECPELCLPLPQEPAFSTAQSRSKAMALVVALTLDGFARGDLFWDDGDSWETFERGDYTEILFLASNVSTRSWGHLGRASWWPWHTCERGSTWGRAPGGALGACGVAESREHSVPSPLSPGRRAQPAAEGQCPP